MWWPRTPRPGDLITTTEDLHLNLTDALTGYPTIPAGTRGYVRTVHRHRLEASFDTGMGTIDRTVASSACRVVRRQVDESAFRSRTSTRAAVRWGALIVVAAPFLYFAVLYWWSTGSLDGLIEAVALAAVDSALELPGMILAHPVQTLLWLSVGWLTTRIAFGKPTRPRK